MGATWHTNFVETINMIIQKISEILMDTYTKEIVIIK